MRADPVTYNSRAVGERDRPPVPQFSPLNRAFLILIALLGWLGIVLQLWVSARLAMQQGDSPWHGII